MSAISTIEPAAPSVCFIAPYAYGELTGTDNGHAGGIERQQVLMARRLRERGIRTTLITWDEGQADGLEVDGVTVRNLCRESDGAPILRFFHPRWTSLWGALRKADADVYYYNLGDRGLGQMVAWCRRHGRASVYSVANDPDCDPRLPTLRPLRERLLYRYGLRHVDRIIVQTVRQRDMLRTGFGRESTVIRMPGDEGENLGQHRPELPSDGNLRVLWVGRFSYQKRLEWLLDVAESCPGWTFDVVGDANAGDTSARAVVERGRLIPNVVFHGRLTRQELAGPFQKAHVLCNTSRYEGFPNTFLEAWCYGMPVVTTFDPDGLVASHDLGRTAVDPRGLVEALRAVTSDGAAYRALSERCYRYFREHHALEVILPQFEQVFRDVADARARRGPSPPHLIVGQ